MKTAYFDCIAGASGDMLLGALIDAGLPVADLESELSKLNLDDFHLHVGKVMKNAFAATKVDVHAHDHAPERHLKDLCEVVENSGVSDRVKERAVRVFTRICQEEARIHNMAVDEVHLHEVGGVDAIVDVVGVLAAVELMGIERVTVSPLPMGRGFIHGAHGQIPLPAPATLGLLKGVPICGSPIDVEFVTPTGAALLTELADAWGVLPSMTLQEVGYGAGTRDLEIPNVLRVLIGASSESGAWQSESITVLETHLDNDRGETLGHAFEKIMEAGALDVVSIPAQMKKNRPAHVVKVLAKPEDADRLERLLFEETSTLGVRRSDTRRDALHRDFDTVDTRYGKIQVKVAKLPSGALRATPEYEDCRKAAEEHGVSLHTVTHEAEHAAAHKFGIPH
ncbi:nickel pincer cofactor biosynthesis protein LarC [Verrucomicrobiaceae bacterium N1E253]|uniref:Pyridinium-3,5-bisthiocarboxylic acid mononucleotide nickel insertion protein n=1 Tax=Oceaniferula marina TaxID=2748318 RepID=A0A851GGM2_9BACT|nr:nickel pincer cofactor biosynthesis protein LarC [Oceaniferula marina]NWK54395.1 nickel pincer cofactor biosynthesis protein LarC [Oceaniferula marina]